MLKVLLLRNNVNPENKFGGIRKHCQELYELFQDCQSLCILPIKDIPTRDIPILHKKIFRWNKLYEYIKESNCDMVHIHGFATLDVVQSIIASVLLKKK